MTGATSLRVTTSKLGEGGFSGRGTDPQTEAYAMLNEPTEMDKPEVIESELLGFESYADEDEQLGDAQLDDEQLDDDPSLAMNTDCPLYSGASLTESSSNILIMQYKRCHNLADQALADLLHLLRL